MNKQFVLSHISKKGYSNLSFYKKRGKKYVKVEHLDDIIDTPETKTTHDTNSEETIETKKGGKIYKRVLVGMGNLDFSSSNVKPTKRENIKLIV